MLHGRKGEALPTVDHPLDISSLRARRFSHPMIGIGLLLAEYDKLSLVSQPICRHNMLCGLDASAPKIACGIDFAKGIGI
jgi:hypothetical protein